MSPVMIFLCAAVAGFLCAFISFTTTQKQWLEKEIDIPLETFQKIQKIWLRFSLYHGFIVFAFTLFIFFVAYHYK